MIHWPGKANVQAEALSRMAQHQISDSKDNWQQVVLKSEHFSQIAATLLHNPIEDQIQQASQREAQVLEGLWELKWNRIQRLANGIAEWEEDNGLVYH